MPQIPTAGTNAYVNYGFESSYGAGASGTRTFGNGTKITVSRKNNVERINSLGFRNAQVAAAKKYEGSASVEFVLSNASFFRALLGQVVDAGVGPYTHTYTETNSIPSFAIDTGTELGTNDEVTELQGCKINTATLTATVGELVKGRLEILYSNETLATTPLGSAVAETEEPFTFAHGTVELPNGTPIGNVQSIELTVNNTIEMKWGLGSRIADSAIEKIREYNIRMTVAFEDTTTLLTKFFGQSTGPTTVNTPAPTATLQLTFSNGLAGTAERTIEINFANIYFDTETLPKDVNEMIKEDVEAFALSCTNVVWTNNTSTDAGNP